MKTALLIIDLVEDTFGKHSHLPVTQAALAMVPRINEVIRACRQRGLPVIFSTDSFLENDFVFQGKMKPHSIRGTRGAEVYSGLDRQPGDVVLPKRRFSAFYKTDLDQSFRLWGVDTVAVTGIATHVCVLATALDALSNDFKAIMIEDCCASMSEDMHNNCLNLYRRSPLFPLFQVMPSQEFMEKIGSGEQG
ncbi:MAG: cysteine hydrolase [Deltaproteobacteria bacterium]|nr:cysteine hydrolase [Deltaproteobacteria bacterium]